jgi:hypothetical protein
LGEKVIPAQAAWKDIREWGAAWKDTLAWVAENLRTRNVEALQNETRR